MIISGQVDNWQFLSPFHFFFEPVSFVLLSITEYRYTYYPYKRLPRNLKFGLGNPPNLIYKITMMVTREFIVPGCYIHFVYRFAYFPPNVTLFNNFRRHTLI